MASTQRQSSRPAENIVLASVCGKTIAVTERQHAILSIIGSAERCVHMVDMLHLVGNSSSTFRDVIKDLRSRMHCHGLTVVGYPGKGYCIELVGGRDD